jgi:hypothetical protein
MAICFIVLSLLVLAATQQKLGSDGITFSGPKRSLEANLTALAVIGSASGVAFPLVFALGFAPTSWRGGLILALISAAA